MRTWPINYQSQVLPDCLSPKAQVAFDTDSIPIKIDNCCTRTMSYSRADFIKGTLVPLQDKSVLGFGASRTQITHMGTIRWKIADNNGVVQTLTIPNSFFVPTGTVRLLSPQHLAQEMDDNFPSQMEPGVRRTRVASVCTGTSIRNR
jgi:hypothetical protein